MTELRVYFQPIYKLISSVPSLPRPQLLHEEGKGSMRMHEFLYSSPVCAFHTNITGEWSRVCSSH